ncbi:aromatic amino acid DMT transporter YddG [Dickeya fangzhongdai]|uniref:aromatic amino acid DMT transporter YddG n=1 Tax=Dickeya fangzhongdai TaxID=1778540 RepID=UPI003F5D30BD
MIAITPYRATLAGLLAIMLWSTSVGLIRSLTEALGALGGAAMIYTTSALFLLLFGHRPTFRSHAKIYLLLSGALFVSYEICFSLSIGLAQNRMQAMELGMINYLWPCLTILFSLFINQQKSRFWLWPGLALSVTGVLWILKGDGDWSPALMWRNISANPLAYGMALIAALVWALYCNVSRRFGNGKSGILLFFITVSAVLWGKYLLSDAPGFSFPAQTHAGTVVHRRLHRAGLCRLGCRYSTWQHGATGNRVLLYADTHDADGGIVAANRTYLHFLARRHHGDAGIAAFVAGHALNRLICLRTRFLC